MSKVTLYPKTSIGSLSIAGEVCEPTKDGGFLVPIEHAEWVAIAFELTNVKPVIEAKPAPVQAPIPVPEAAPLPPHVEEVQQPARRPGRKITEG